jgi:hypothetical protein
MSEKRTSISIDATGPAYLAWRGQLLAELALVRIPELLVHKRPEHAAPDLEYDFLVSTVDGLCFFVKFKSFSSIRQKSRHVDTADELRLTVDADFIRRACANQTPVLLFLFDADADHGRFLRLDTLPEPASDDKHYVLRFPKKNTIDKESLEKAIAALHSPITA